VSSRRHRPGDRHDANARQRGHDRLHIVLASYEGGDRGDRVSSRRAHGLELGERRRKPDHRDLEHAFPTVEVAQLVLAEIDEVETWREIVAQELLGRV
jgi:hypothetical protein